MTASGGLDMTELDHSGMFEHIRAVGRELARAWDQSETLELPRNARQANGVVIAGMGGSATAGDYLAAICNVSSEMPVAVVRGYRLPNWVSAQTLVVVSSYSGNTEESLSCYDDGWKRGAMLMAITRGGRLAERAESDNVPVHPITYESAPRAALAHSLGPLLRLGLLLGIHGVASDEVREAAERHQQFVEDELERDVPEERNGAKQVARELQGRVAFVLGADHLAPVAARYKNQLAENGKALGAADVLPEADHNLIVGLATADAVRECVALVTLESGSYHERTRQRFALTSGYFREAGIPVRQTDVSGRGLLEELLVGTAWGDYVSCYLALLNGQDPSPVPQIDRLKAELG